MVSRLFTANPSGMHRAIPIEVEVDVRQGLPRFEIIGCAEHATREGRGRITIALRNSEFSVTDQKITINLAPSGLPKLGSGFDLPIAVGILASSGIIRTATDYSDSFFFGELGLDGQIKSVPDSLCYFRLAAQYGFKKIYCPADSINLLSGGADLPLVPVRMLSELVDHLNTGAPLLAPALIELVSAKPTEIKPPAAPTVSLDDVVGQWEAKRALSVALAGGHHLLLIGPPGVGKSLLARTLSQLLPALGPSEWMETEELYALAGMPRAEADRIRSPFRSPHHSVSYSALIGGGSRTVSPGEVSLAHRGVLFLDEFAEFRRDAIEALREPLESGVVTIGRSEHRMTLRARFQLVAASNPCACGGWGAVGLRCHCSHQELVRYRRKFSRPLLDRIDLQIGLDRETNSPAPSTAPVSLSRIELARERQRERYRPYQLTRTSEIPGPLFNSLISVTPDASRLLSAYSEANICSLRVMHNLLRVSQTIADLEPSDSISSAHVEEAIQLRSSAERFQVCP